MDLFVKLISEYAVLTAGAILVALIVVPYILIQSRRSKKVKVKIAEAKQFGLHEPVSIHPIINKDICIGSGACIKACPEKDILGLVHGKAEAVYKSRCVGHGACARACPVGAIELVFGTEKRGVELPDVMPNFETNMDRIFIAGELGGMGLIKNAMLQGQEAVEYIAADLKKAGFPKAADIYDLVIVGSGPAGIAATLKAKSENLKTITLDQERRFGGAILSYPRAKIVMTSPVKVPLYGTLKKRTLSKEELLEVMDNIDKKTSLNVETGEKVNSVDKYDDYFVVKTAKRELKSRFILLCIGRRGTPRKLGVPGEQLPKVMYRMLDPEKFAGEKILVVGGGDSAVEAAVALAGQEGTELTLSYRKAAFARIKPGNTENLDIMVKGGQVTLVMESTVKEIKESSVILSVGGGTREVANDSVFIFAGGELPNAFLKNIGIDVITKFGTR